MKGIAGFVVAAVFVALAGAVCMGIARFERNMASAEEDLATLRYADAAEKLSSASAYAEYTGWLPGQAGQAARDLRARQASAQYWQREYEALMPRESDPVGAVEGENVSLQLLVANGVYRAGQGRASTKETSMQALDEAIAGYLTVLKGDEWDERAAYNYEYLVRLRDDLAKGRRKSAPPPDSEDASLGTAGAPAKTTDMKKFEVYIPLEGEERNQAAEAGKATPSKRKG
jgi:hypothetical protein